MAHIKQSRMERSKKRLKRSASGEAPRGPGSSETRNPLPENDYTHKQQPYCDDEENDPEIDGR